MSCYVKDDNKILTSGGQSPCSNATGFQHCCQAGDKCLPDGFCYFTHQLSATVTGYYLGGCTDPKFEAAVCPQHCTDEPTQDVWYNTTNGIWSGCNRNGDLNCADPSDEGFAAPAPAILMSSTSITSTSTSKITTSLSTQTSSSKSASAPSSSTSHSSSSSSHSDLDVTTVALATVIPVVVMILALALCFWWWFRKRRSQKNNASAQALPKIDETGQEYNPDRAQNFKKQNGAELAGAPVEIEVSGIPVSELETPDR